MPVMRPTMAGCHRPSMFHSVCAVCNASWPPGCRPDSLAECFQRQLSIGCCGHGVHAHAAQNAHAISLILEDVALIAHYDLQSNTTMIRGMGMTLTVAY